MKKIITTGIIVLSFNIALAQKEVVAPATPPIIENAQVKTHSNTNNNRSSGNTPKVNGAILGTGESGTKAKSVLGRLFKKK